MSDTIPPRPPGRDLAYKLNRLFATMHSRHRGEYTLQEVIDGIRQRGGPTLSMTYLSQLRNGTRDNPTKQHLEALADFFGVNPAYFFDAAAADQIDAQLDLLAAMREAGVREIALRAAELSPEGQRALATIIAQVRQLQGESRREDERQKGATEQRSEGECKQGKGGDDAA